MKPYELSDIKVNVTRKSNGQLETLIDASLDKLVNAVLESHGYAPLDKADYQTSITTPAGRFAKEMEQFNEAINAGLGAMVQGINKIMEPQTLPTVVDPAQKKSRRSKKTA